MVSLLCVLQLLSMTLLMAFDRVQAMFYDLPSKGWKDLGVGALRIATRNKQVEGGSTEKIGRLVFSLPSTSGGTKEKVLVSAALARGQKVETSMDAKSGSGSITLLLVNASKRDASGPQLQKFLFRVKTAAQQQQIVDAIKKATE